MKQHPFDPVSAFFGIIIGGSALAVTLADERVFDISGRWVWPAVIILAGVLLLGSGLAKASRDED
jgi:hypothetical protein